MLLVMHFAVVYSAVLCWGVVCNAVCTRGVPHYVMEFQTDAGRQLVDGKYLKAIG
jgi:hypothetical protein